MNPDPGQEFSFVIGFALIFMAIVELCTGRYFDRKAQKEGGGGGGGGGGAAARPPPVRVELAARRPRSVVARRGRAAGADERHAAASRRVEAGGRRQRQHVLLQRGDGRLVLVGADLLSMRITFTTLPKNR